MASSKGTSQATEQSIIVILSAQPSTSNVTFPERRIELTPKSPTIQIGRASKVASKGCIAAADNAWFESPVMSREHAELKADFDTKTVSVRDVASLHGTFHQRNGPTDTVRKLETTPVDLIDGDVLRFGTDIYRAQETFPPCWVEVRTEWRSRATSTNRYALDDDILLSDSDDDLMETDFPLPLQFTQPTVDLTKDDHQASSKSYTTGPSSQTGTIAAVSTNYIDLTSEPDRDVEVLPADPIQVPFVNQSEQAGSNNDDKSLAEAIENTLSNELSAAEILRNVWAESDGDDSDDGVDQPDLDEDLRLTDSEYDSDVPHQIRDTEGLSDEESISSHDEASDDSNSVLSFGDGDIHLEASDDSVMNEEEFHGTESDVGGLTESEDADDIFDNHELPFTESPPSSSPMMPEAKEIDSPQFVAPDLREPIPTLTSSTMSIPVSNTTTMGAIEGVTTKDHTNSMKVTADRAPSPSDAAMVKRGTMASIPRSAAQALGEASGKFEYFEARETNRRVVMGDSPGAPTSAIRETLAGHKAEGQVGIPRQILKPTGPSARLEALRNRASAQSESQDTSRVQTAVPAADKTLSEAVDDHSQRMNQAFVNQDPDILASKDNHRSLPPLPPRYSAHSGPDIPSSLPVQSSAWDSSAHEFLTNPRSAELPSLALPSRTRLQSPDFDMTSAYAFQQSKLAAENKASQHVKRVPIQDLLESRDASADIYAGNDESPANAASESDPQHSLVGSNIVRGVKRKSDDLHTAQPSTQDATDLPGSQTNVRAGTKTLRHRPAHSLAGDLALSASTSAAATGQTESTEPTQGNDQLSVRPAKRRRGLAEKAAYFAIGGAVIGTGLMTTLISFAPTLAQLS